MAAVGQRFFQTLRGRHGLHQKTRLTTVRVQQSQVGPQGFAMLGDGRVQVRREGLALGQAFVRQLQCLFQDVANPGPVDGRIGLQAEPVARSSHSS